MAAMLNCRRCGYATTNKSNLIKHLNNKTPCEATLECVPREELISELRARRYTENDVRCEVCNKQFKSACSMRRHMRQQHAPRRSKRSSTTRSPAPATSVVDEQNTTQQNTTVADLVKKNEELTVAVERLQRDLNNMALAAVRPVMHDDSGASQSINEEVSAGDVQDQQSNASPDEHHPTPDTASGVAIIPGIPVTIRKTNGTPPLVSVIDLIAAVEGISNKHASTVFERLVKNHPDVSTNCGNIKFPGRGQRDTPVTDARGVVTIINLLSGPKPAAFRAQFADIVVRFLGGDETLIAQIRRNAEIQATLPANHPAAFFGQSVRPEQSVIIEVTSLEPDAGQPELSLPDATRPPNCVYCIFIGYCVATDRRIYTFGQTQDLQARVAEHRKTFPHTKVVFAVSLGQYSPVSVETAVRNMEPVRSRALKVLLPNGVNRQDCFACAKHEVEGVLRELLSELNRSHGHKVQDMWAYDPALLPVMPGLPGPLQLATGPPVQDLPSADAAPMIEYGGAPAPVLMQSKTSPVLAGWGPTLPSALPDPESLIQMERERTRQAELAVEAERVKAESEREREKTAQLRLQLQLEMVRLGHVDHALKLM